MLVKERTRMRLRCKSCGAQIEARDVTLAALKALCPACGSKFHFGQEDVPPIGLGISGEPEALKPRHYRLQEQGDALILRRSWRDGPLDWMAYVILAWYSLLGLGLWQNWRSTLPVAQSFQLYMLVVVLACVGVLGIYALLQGLFNATTISISPKALRISHGPIRVSRRRALQWDYATPSPQIRQIFARMAVNPSSAPSIHGGYDLHVILHSGVHEVALHGLPTEEEAKFLCQRIRKHLKLPRARFESRPTPEQVPRPEKIEVDITPETLNLTYRFGTLLSLSPALATGVVGLIVVLVLLASQALEGRTFSWISWPVGPLTCAELLLLLCTLRLAIRTRCIRVDKESLILEDRPAKLTMCRRFPRAEIEQVFCTARPRFFRPPWRTGSAAALIYEVWLLSRDEKRTRLISRLVTADEAFFIEQEIERHLGIEDAVVKGEITRPGSAKAMDLQRQLNQRHDLLSALRLEATYTIGQKFPPSLPKLLQLYQTTEDSTLLEEASRILQLPTSELERLMWEFEEGQDAPLDVIAEPRADAPAPLSRAPGPIPKGAVTKSIPPDPVQKSAS
jgi:hypothetical protein